MLFRSTRAVIIAGGKLLSDGTPEQLLSHSPQHNRVRVRLDGAAREELQTALAGLEAVGDVSACDERDGAACFQLTAAGAASVGDAVGALVRERGWQIHELTVEKGRLDEVFRDITAPAQVASHG